MTRLSPPLLGIVILILLAVMAPLVVPVAMSISDTPYIKFPPQGFTLQWYGQVLLDPEAQASFLFSLKLAAIVTALSLALGIPCAMGLVRHKIAGSPAILALVLSPLVVPLLVGGVALLQATSMLASRATFAHLVIGHAIVCLPYVVRAVSASLLLVDRNLEDAGAVLGAPPWLVALRVTWPQIRPGVLTGAVFAFIVSFDDFPISMWLADADHFPIPLFLYSAIEKSFDPSIAAISSLMIAFAIGLVFIIEKIFGISIDRLAS